MDAEWQKPYHCNVRGGDVSVLTEGDIRHAYVLRRDDELYWCGYRPVASGYAKIACTADTDMRECQRKTKTRTIGNPAMNLARSVRG